ncbi:30S ribosomal protein S16 [Flexithrix dorotheae]|uniref:30S ribosomal protein S16 n=1 Tax=Flexithrix dorotheae TaxID=70993 RepID=UPI0003760F11|nr:30S ribosomal protein S16 [Flexithrix dorotheae]
MAVKIRFARRGRSKKALFDIVVADSKSPRDGRFIEKLGLFNPHTDENNLNFERALYWVMVGAQPTDTARSLLSKEGVMLKKHLQVGVNKGAITQEVADQRFEEWKTSKLSQKEAEEAAKAKAIADKKAADEAEMKKLREAERKAEEEAKAAAVAEAQAKAEAEAQAAKEAKAELEKAKEEEAAPAEEAKAEEAPAEETPAPEAKAEEAPAKEEEKKAE